MRLDPPPCQFFPAIHFILISVLCFYSNFAKNLPHIISPCKILDCSMQSLKPGFSNHPIIIKLHIEFTREKKLVSVLSCIVFCHIWKSSFYFGLKIAFVVTQFPQKVRDKGITNRSLQRYMAAKYSLFSIRPSFALVQLAKKICSY